MAEKRKYLNPQDLITHLKTMSQAHLNGAADRVEAAQGQLNSARRALQLAHCEDFFSKMDTLLPTHESSRTVAHQFLMRLCAGKPDLPAEMA